MPGSTTMPANDEVVILEDQEPPRVLSAPPSSLSVLDPELVQDLIAVAEGAVRVHLASIQAPPRKPEDDDDDIEVISEKIQSAPTQTVLPLKLPKSLQVRVVEQLKAKGKSADKIDLISLASELLSNTIKSCKGLNVTNCSLKISSTSKKRSHPNSNSEGSPALKSSKLDRSFSPLPPPSINDSTDWKLPPSKPVLSLKQNGVVHSSKSDKKTEKPIIKLPKKRSTRSSPPASNDVVKPADKSSSTSKVIKDKNHVVVTEEGAKNKSMPLPPSKNGSVVPPLKVKLKAHGKMQPIAVVNKKVKPMVTNKNSLKVILRPPKKNNRKEKRRREKRSAKRQQPPEVKPKILTEPILTNAKKKKSKLRGPHREHDRVKFLRRVGISCQDNKFVNVNVFKELFGRDLNLNPNAIMASLTTTDSTDFKFKNWTMNGLSLRAASETVRLLKKPLYVSSAFDQLQVLPRIPLKRVDQPKHDLTQLSRVEFCDLFSLQNKDNVVDNPETATSRRRSSMRSKVQTKKFQNSTCHSSMASLSKSISPSKVEANGVDGVEPEHLGVGVKRTSRKDWREMEQIAKQFQVHGRLRPKYRALILKKRNKIQAVEDNNVVIVKDNQELASLDSQNGDIIDVTEMSARLQEESETGIPEAMKRRLAVRKFPSYGWNREREARIRIEATMSKQQQQQQNNVKTAKAVKAPVDFPMFQLSGLAETAPKEVEGWFTSKLSLLRRLSDNKETAVNVNGTSGSTTNGKKTVKTTKNGSGKPSVKAVLDQNCPRMVDLGEYKTALEQHREILEEIAAAEESNGSASTSTTTADQETIEALKVAKKIEKISNQGINRSFSLPNPNSFLPPGWHCRKLGQGWEYVSNHGVRVQTVQAAISHDLEAKRS